MDALDTVSTVDLIDELCRRSVAIGIALVSLVDDAEVSFRLHGDLMTRSGLIQTLLAAQQASIREWMGHAPANCDAK